MRSSALILGAFLLSSIQDRQQPTGASPSLPVKYGEATYPPIGRAAHVAGDVVLTLRVAADGTTQDVAAVGGPKMLQNAAVEIAKGWVFATGAERTMQATIKFRLRADEYDDYPITTTTHFDAAGNETVSASTSTSNKSRSQCPDPDKISVPQNPLPGDSITLSRSACYGSCPGYTVRVQRDGTVFWEGMVFVATMGKATTKLPERDVPAIFQAFQSADFWRACGAYSESITDSATDALTADIGGLHKNVEDYASSAPEAIRKLESLVDAVTDSHRWRVGDPKQESIAEIDRDSYLPKPGKTKLMQASAEGKPEEQLAAMEAGDSVTATDSSGWTPLMYAASGSSSLAVQLLLQHGADPNVRGPHGETALLFAALSRDAEADLIAAGADVNAAMDDGVTALMLLAQSAEAEEIQALLKAGAKATAKDREGRTALDYLLAASCGRKIVGDPESFMSIGYARCNALDGKDLKAARIVLKKAGVQPARAWSSKPLATR